MNAKLMVPTVGPVHNDKDGHVIRVFGDDILESSIDCRKLASFLREFLGKEDLPTTFVKIIDVKANKESYKKTDNEIIIEGTVQVFHLGKKELWDAEDYVLMDLGAKYALGGELAELFPDTNKITNEYVTYENLYIDEYNRIKDLVTITGKYGLHYE
ncbi:MAG: hypothetical protein HOK52_13650 [Candidatus Marinimicrobia bacterium]|nr:hypothetical protein [Candidatus Neomarinimicrobiota bacterium]